MKKIIAAFVLFLIVLGSCKKEEDPKYAQFNYYVKMQPSSLFDSIHFNITNVRYDNMLDQRGWDLSLNESAVFDLGKESQMFLGSLTQARILDYKNEFRHGISTKNHWVVDKGEFTELSLQYNFGPNTSAFKTGMDVQEGDVVDVIFNLDVDKSVRLDSAGADWIKWVGEVEMIKKWRVVTLSDSEERRIVSKGELKY